MPITFSANNSKFEKALQGNCEESLLNKLVFTKVVIDDTATQWQFYFECESTLEKEEIEALKKAVNALIPKDAKPELCIQYMDFNCENIKSIVIDTLKNSKPAYAMGLTDSLWSLNDSTINILLNTLKAGNSLVSNGLAGEISKIIKDCFNKVVQVKLELNVEKEDSLLEEYVSKIKELENKATSELPIKSQSSKHSSSANKSKNKVLLGSSFRASDITPLKDISELSNSVIVQGELLGIELTPLKSGKSSIVVIRITDYTSSITVKLLVNNRVFIYNNIVEELQASLADAGMLILKGQCEWDKYSRETVLMCSDIMRGEMVTKTDDAQIKRVELHLHTRMSQMDSVVDPEKLVKMLVSYGHDAVAITDHGVVQAFPGIEKAVSDEKADIKIIFGVEAYLLDDCQPFIDYPIDEQLENLTYVVFDIESTGLNPNSNKITEIGAVKIKNGEIIDRFSQLINPHESLRQEIVELTNITDAMLVNCPDISEVLPRFLEFSKDCVMVAHNADFDLSFIRAAANRLNLSFETSYIDTLRLSRELLKELKTHKLNKVCKHLGISLEGHHRAVNDSEATGYVFLKLINILKEQGVFSTEQLNNAYGQNSAGSFHAVIYAKNKIGLLNLYTLITESHLKYLHKQHPRIPKSLFTKYREGLMITSACEAGELYSALLEGVTEHKIEKICKFYDYLEVQPIGNNAFLIREGKVENEEQLRNFNLRILELGEKFNKPVIATGDVHFLKPQDEFFRRVIQNSQGYSDAHLQAPLYYRTTAEMLAEFSYLPIEKREEIVIHNPRSIAAQCEKMESFPRDKLYTPKMEGAEEQISEMAYKNAKEIYGEELPEMVSKRLDKELTAIIKHGFAVLYLIAHKVVNKSLSEGYLVGSRGSVGSSFAATMTNITEVNPLPPHYVCPKCKYSDFEIDLEKYDCGIDLPEKNCPNCGEPLKRLGFNIPFEVFMGFDGDKAPDIDLNFSGDYQPTIHKYIEELFGKDYVFRAGTIGGIADKTAIGYALKYFEEKGGSVNSAELKRIAEGCMDVKRTTGQHPGGMVVLPKEYDINQFTPLQYPANDPSKGIITTHFDFNSLHDTMLKLDILGHDDPTAIRMLEDMTGIKALEIPLNDPKVMSLFLSTEALGVTSADIGSEVGTYGIPEFGTAFVRKMLVETRPTTFSDLVKISGLSHGTDVWANNAQVLIRDNITTLAGTICTREDIMNTLIYKGVSSKIAFKTMESVRKGRGLSEDAEIAMSNAFIPDWFIDSCKKIKYMFPKAHAAAYVTMALRIAYFKVYYPLQYYITYFSVRADDFEIGLMQGGVESLKYKIKEYYEKTSLNAREKGILTMLEIAVEMKKRGIDFADIDLYKSDATKFLTTQDGKILPPLTAVPSLGETAALSILAAREKEPFRSQEDLLSRTKLSTTLIEVLQNIGCLKDLPSSIQINIFELA